MLVLPKERGMTELARCPGCHRVLPPSPDAAVAPVYVAVARPNYVLGALRRIAEEFDAAGELLPAVDFVDYLTGSLHAGEGRP